MVETKPVPISAPIIIPIEVEPRQVIDIKEEKPTPIFDSNIIESSHVVSSSQISNISQSRVLETKKFVLEHEMPSLPPLGKIETKPIEFEKHEPIVHEIPVTFEATKEEIPPKVEETEGIETSSITKQSSLDFFKSKLKESSEMPAPQVTEVQKISADIFSKFEAPVVDQFETKKQHVEIKEQYTPFPFSAQEYSVITPIKTTFEEFGLVPEPPPEIGFIPKSEVQKKKEVPERIKRLEDSHKELSPIEVPTGAVKIFPTAQTKVTEDAHYFKSERKEHEIFSATTPILRPQAEISIRPLSPRPSAEAVEMEKLWATHRAVTPEMPEQVRILSPITTPSQAATLEKKWTPYKSEFTEHTSSSAYSTFEKTQQRIGGIAEPSLDGKTMEKMWAHKHVDSHAKVWPPPFMEDVKVTKITPITEKTIVAEEKQWQPVHRFETSSDSIISPAPVTKIIPIVPEKATEEKQWQPVHRVENSSYKATSAFDSVSAPATVTKIIPIVPEKAAEEKQWQPVHRVETSSYKATSAFDSVSSSGPVTKIIPIVTEKTTPWHPVHTRFETSTYKSTAVPDTITVPAPIHYVSDTTVTHISKIVDTSYSTSQHTEVRESRNENVIEESHVKPSEIIKSWPPGPPEQELKAPQMVRETVPKLDALPIRPVSVQDITDEVYLEPGPPPEIGFAEAPRERRTSYVESIEQDLEKNLEKEPSRVLPGSVRTIPPPRERSLPPPLPPKKETYQAPPLPIKPIKIEPPKTESKPFEKFPDLEPFPFRPEPERTKTTKLPPPPTPSKFIKGRFADSDYESDFEAVRIPVMWKPCQSDTEDHSYRKVKPPKLTAITRSRSTEPEPLPPTKFDHPPITHGPPRPDIDLEATKREIKKDISIKQLTKQTKKEFKTRQIHKPASPPLKPSSPPKLKPGSPPEFMYSDTPKLKPESPKAKVKVYQESGYMADTDEPFLQTRKVSKIEHQESSSKTEIKHISHSSESYQRSQSMFESHSSSSLPHVPSKAFHKYEHKKQVSTTAPKKVSHGSVHVDLC